MSRSTHMSLERGVLFFEDGTEVSNVSVELIQAAPEMLIALKGLVDVLHHQCEQFLDGDDGFSEIYNACQAAKDAITKATGDTNE